MLRALGRYLKGVPEPSGPLEDDGSTNETMSFTPTEAHVLFLLERLERRQDAASQEAEATDGKVAIASGAATVLLGLMVASLYEVGPQDAAYRWLMTAITLLAGSVVFGVGSLWPRSVDEVPNPEKFWAQYYERNHLYTMGRLGATLAESHSDNRRLRMWKILWAKVHLLLLVLGVIALLIALLLRSGQ